MKSNKFYDFPSHFLGIISTFIDTLSFRYKLKSKYDGMVNRQMQELINSPKAENRMMEDKMFQLKQREVQRTIQINLEVKKTTEWTMPKLKENVLTRKEREKEEKLKELEQKRQAKALRHQLEHQNVLSSVGTWLTKRLGTMVKKIK